MKVKELIELLKAYDPNMIVYKENQYDDILSRLDYNPVYRVEKQTVGYGESKSGHRYYASKWSSYPLIGEEEILVIE